MTSACAIVQNLDQRRLGVLSAWLARLLLAADMEIIINNYTSTLKIIIQVIILQCGLLASLPWRLLYTMLP